MTPKQKAATAAATVREGLVQLIDSGKKGDGVKEEAIALIKKRVLAALKDQVKITQPLYLGAQCGTATRDYKKSWKKLPDPPAGMCAFRNDLYLAAYKGKTIILGRHKTWPGIMYFEEYQDWLMDHKNIGDDVEMVLCGEINQLPDQRVQHLIDVLDGLNIRGL